MQNKKQVYESPVLDVVTVSSDIITTSGIETPIAGTDDLNFWATDGESEI